MKKFCLIIVALSAFAAANAQITLYNNLGGNFDNAYWDTDGGAASTSTNVNYGSATGQVITDSGATSITGVETAYLGVESSSDATGVLVQVFNFSGGVVGSLVGSQSISSSHLTENDSLANTGQLGADGYTDWDIAMATNIGGIVSGQQYLVVAQLQSSRAGYQGISYTGNPHVYLDDESSFGYGGIYGLSSWTEAGAHFGSGYSGDGTMKVTGASTPEPASMAVLGLGALAMLRRRRR